MHWRRRAINGGDMENMEQEKMFTQAEVDEIIAKRLARSKNKQEPPATKDAEESETPEETTQISEENKTDEQAQSDEQATEEQNKDLPEAENASEDATDKQPEQPEQPEQPKVQSDILVKLARAELKGAMAMQGVDPQKLDRAVRLIGHEEFMDEAGNINNDRMVELITELIGNWPELRRQDQNSKFKFGIGQSDNTVTNNLIAKAFGNN